MNFTEAVLLKSPSSDVSWDTSWTHRVPVVKTNLAQVTH